MEDRSKDRGGNDGVSNEGSTASGRESGRAGEDETQQAGSQEGGEQGDGKRHRTPLSIVENPPWQPGAQAHAEGPYGQDHDHRGIAEPGFADPEDLRGDQQSCRRNQEPDDEKGHQTDHVPSDL